MEKLKIPAKLVTFGAIVALLVTYLGKLFQPVYMDWNQYNTLYGFYEEPKNSIETVFLGTSVIAGGINPTELYRDYGISSYNMGTVSQPMMASYYWLKEVYRANENALKNVMLDISKINSTSTSEAFYRRAFDPMKLSTVKFSAFWDMTDGDISKTLAYISPVSAYHSRWESLTEEDFDKFQYNPVNGTRGYHFIPWYYAEGIPEDSVIIKSTVVDTAAEIREIEEETLIYLNKIIDFCEEKNLSLTFIKTPTTSWDSTDHNTMEKFAKDKGITFMDFSFEPLYSELNLIYGYDGGDKAHLNFYGSSKLTKALGEYIVQNCEYTDVRGSAEYSHLDSQLELYDECYKQQIVLLDIPDLYTYLKTAINEGNTVFIAVKDDGGTEIDDETRKYAEEIGLPGLAELKYLDSYLAVITDGNVVYEQVQDGYDKTLGSISYEGVTPNNKKYHIESASFYQGDIASIILEEKDYAINSRGLNIVVYNHNNDVVLNKSCFDTRVKRTKPVYNIELSNKIVMGEVSIDELNGISKGAYIYHKQTQNLALKDGLGKVEDNEILKYLDHYMDTDKAIYIAVRDEATSSMSKELRAHFADMGLEKLSDLGYRESYIACIENGKVTHEKTGSINESIKYQADGVAITSAGYDAGDKCSIKVNDIEEAINKTGINIVVYDQEIDRVVDSTVFNTCTVPQTVN